MGTTQRYLMFVSYLGSSFCGSQLQTVKEGNPIRETVQYVLENGFKCLYLLRGERPIPVKLASRTDKGVHALKAAVQVDLPPLGKNFPKPEVIKKRLNSYFTNLRNVRILEVYAVPDSFTIHGSVLDKTYLYRIGLLREEFKDLYTGPVIPITEIERTGFFMMKEAFDLKKAQEAAQLFEGKKDFGAVVGRPNSNTRPTVCNIISFTVEEAQPLTSFDHLSQKFNYYHYICRGDRFLYHMVRRMVSLSLFVGLNKLSMNDIKKLFDEPVPSSWPKHAHFEVCGDGLYLKDTNIDLEKISKSDDSFEEKTEDISLVGEC